MWLLAKNPARDTHKCVYKYKTMNSFSLVSASPECGGKCRACEAIGARVRTQVRIISRICSHLPLPTAGAATFPDKRGRLTLLIHLTKQASNTIKTMISFFLSVSFPRTRWQANCVFRSIATRKHNETLCLWLGKCRALRGDRGMLAYTGQNHFTCLLTLAPSDGYRRHLPRQAGTAFYVSHFVIFRFCSYLLFIFTCLLTHFYSVALLLEKRFACFPSSGEGLKLAFFPLFPDKRGRLFCVSHFNIFWFHS